MQLPNREENGWDHISYARSRGSYIPGAAASEKEAKRPKHKLFLHWPTRPLQLQCHNIWGAVTARSGDAQQHLPGGDKVNYR